MLQGKDFEVGPFRLGRWQLPVNLAAVAWVAISTVRPPYMSITADLLLRQSRYQPGPALVLITLRFP